MLKVKLVSSYITVCIVQEDTYRFLGSPIHYYGALESATVYYNIIADGLTDEHPRRFLRDCKVLLSHAGGKKRSSPSQRHTISSPGSV